LGFWGTGLSFAARSYERTNAKPTEDQSECRGSGYSGNVSFAGVVGSILSYRSHQSSHRKCNKNKARDLQPELPDHSGQVTKRRPRPGQDRAIGSSTLYLLSCDAGCYAQLAPRRDVCHLLSILPIPGFRILSRWGCERKPEMPAASKSLVLDNAPGDFVDQQLKHLMKELGEAINESLADSEQIADVVSRIKDGGYDIFLVLEATIGVSRPGEKSSDKTSMVTTLSSNPELKVSDQDLKFLKSLRIKIENDAA
jgi:hypothetical protein